MGACETKEGKEIDEPLQTSSVSVKKETFESRTSTLNDISFANTSIILESYFESKSKEEKKVSKIVNQYVHYYINQIMYTHEHNKSTIVCYEPNISVIKTIFENNPNVKISPRLKGIFTLPDIFVWDPIQQFNLSKECPKCHIKMSTKFKCQQNNQCKPRVVLQIDGIALLLSVNYECKNKECSFEKYNSTTPNYMCSLPRSISQKLPIDMTTKYAVTTELYQLAITSIKKKQNINNFEQCLMHSFKKKFYFQKKVYSKYWIGKGKDITTFVINTLWGSFDQQESCQQHRDFYAELNDYKYYKMLAVPEIHGKICIDHTFKTSGR